MKITVAVDAGEQGFAFEVDLSPEAMDAVRVNFNPSGDARVTELKTAAALLFQLNLNIAEHKQEAARESAVARTNLQTASMWGVLAATKGLPK